MVATRLSISIPASKYRVQWDQIAIMRQFHDAPVDTMGAYALANFNKAKNAEFRFQALIATLLSPQTKDKMTYVAFVGLIDLVNPSPLIPSSLAIQSEADIMAAIKPVSFYKIKAINVKAAAVTCHEVYNDDIPIKIDDLLAFKVI